VHYWLCWCFQKIVEIYLSIHYFIRFVRFYLEEDDLAVEEELPKNSAGAIPPSRQTCLRE
jgi:hypothetical protein